MVPAIVFLLGLIAATFATTDSALTALTTSFCIDFLGMDKLQNVHNPKNVKIRKMIHLLFCLIMFGVIVLFNALNDASVVSMIFRIASYTYGPLLGLFTFGMFFKSRKVHDKWVPLVCLVSPFITLYLSNHSAMLFKGYVFDNELIIVNGLITLLLLLAISYKQKSEHI